jgi:hypothetical protein
MRMVRLFQRFAIALLLLMQIAPQSLAAKSGKTRYSALYRALEPGLVFEKFDQLVAAQHVYSKRPDVSPADIRITIASKSGRMVIAPAEDGRVKFPMTETLLAENPWVESNQPQGSLGLSATMEIRVPDAAQFPYATLYQAMQQAQAALRQLGPEFAGRAIRGADFIFPASSNAEMTIEDARSESLVVANAQGIITIRMDERWVQSKATVKMKSTALAVRPRIE